MPAQEGELADLTYVDLPFDGRRGLLDRLPYVGRGWYSKPACAEMLDSGLAQWRHFRWSHGARGPTLAGAGAADDGSGLAGRGGAHGQALHQRAGGALRPQPGPRLFHENFQSQGGWGGLQLAPDLHGCRGPHALGPRLRHGAAFQQQLPPGARFHHGGGVYSSGQGPTSPGGGAEALPQMSQDRLSGDAGRAKEAPLRHRAAAASVASGRHARLSLRADGGPAGPIPGASPINEKPARVEDPLTHCLEGESLLLTGYPGTGKTHLARKIVEALRELGDTVHIITKTHAAVQNVGLGAQTADHWVRRNVRSGRCSATWLVIEELTQLDTPLWADIACLSMNTSMRFLLLGDFRQLPAVLDSFAGAEVCRELKDSQLLHDLAGGWCHESRSAGASTRGSSPSFSG